MGSETMSAPRQAIRFLVCRRRDNDLAPPGDGVIVKISAAGSAVPVEGRTPMRVWSGENIKAVRDYLGHSDAGFTMRTYTHLMPQSADRTKRAVDDALSCYVSTPVEN
jgi:hypothetical protein